MNIILPDSFLPLFSQYIIGKVCGEIRDYNDEEEEGGGGGGGAGGNIIIITKAENS